MKSVTYPLRFKANDYQNLVSEARRRGKTLAELLRDLIAYGLPALPPIPNKDDTWEKLTAQNWESLGPSPGIDYDKLPKEW